MFGSSKRTFENEDHVKECKKLKHSHHAQRKFASSFPVSPLKRENITSAEISPKAEDFLDFLCVRHTPALAPELEIFAKPQLIRNEIFLEDSGEDDFTALEPLGKTMEAVTQVNSSDKNDRILSRVEKPVFKSEKVALAKTTKSSAEKKHLNIVHIDSVNTKLYEMKDILKVMSNSNVVNSSVALMSPPHGTAIPGYVQEPITISIKTKHIHRLKHSFSKNFITFLCMKKQLEKEPVTLDELPEIGGCELDLPLLYDTVNLFGGIEVVNNDQCWKDIADNLSIPKTASRRVKKIEDIYLKYILPYETLPKNNKIQLRLSITKNANELNTWPVEQSSSKEVSLSSFEKLAANYRNMYCKKDGSFEDIVKQFWGLVCKGERHVCAISAEIDLLRQPLEHQYCKTKVSWKCNDIFPLEESVLRYLGKVSKISAPLLLFEGVFSTTKWCMEEHGFAILSYLHCGDEKVWYVIPDEFTKPFQQLKYEFRKFVTPSELISKGCKVIRCVQKAGQYVLVQPNCYYCSVSTGYACSEVVKIAHMGWLTSRKFLRFKPRLNDFIFTKIILTCSVEESKKGVKSVHARYLIPKLEAISSILSASMMKLKTAGIKEYVCAKVSEWTPRLCSECNICCFLVRVCIKSVPDFSLCVEDALKMIDSKDKSDVLIELLYSVEKVNLLIKKMKLLMKKNKSK